MRQLCGLHPSLGLLVGSHVEREQLFVKQVRNKVVCRRIPVSFSGKFTSALSIFFCRSQAFIAFILDLFQKSFRLSYY